MVCLNDNPIIGIFVDDDIPNLLDILSVVKK